LITGLTRATTRGHIVRATLEAMAFQVADVLEALPAPVEVLRADGGGAANAFLMQFQADILGRQVDVASETDSTALGAAALAGLALGVWRDTDSLRSLIRAGASYEPLMPRDEAEERLEGWKAALRLARTPSAAD
jgi:glycerol kinase